MTRLLTAALLLCVNLTAAACPLCLGAFRPSTAQQLVELQHAVLALPSADASNYLVVEVIKGGRPPGGVIDAAAVQVDVTAKSSKTLLLLARDESWPMWMRFGTIGAEHASWLRQIAAGKHSGEMNASEWQARVGLMLPYLENREPLVAEIAYGEFAAAPYASLLTVKPRLAAPKIRQWLADPKLAARQPLYVLLLGIAGNAQDAASLERQLDAVWKSGDASNLGSLIAADLQLRGPSRMAWVDGRYLSDPKRSTREIEAALLALSVQGNANSVIPRERVIQSYRLFMTARKDLAGYVAQDFATWQYWDAVPDYVALLKSGVKQQYPSYIAIVAYLRQSPAGKTGNIDLPRSVGLSSEQWTNAFGKPNAIPALPQ
ncbi:MAG TPA: hypothetical protein VEN29_20730 [Casimicrobiaceae bacterium]|nr:hypothetical protein [Casimicrobiaceae bacterium]